MPINGIYRIHFFKKEQTFDEFVSELIGALVTIEVGIELIIRKTSESAPPSHHLIGVLNLPNLLSSNPSGIGTASRQIYTT